MSAPETVPDDVVDRVVAFLRGIAAEEEARNE